MDTTKVEEDGQWRKGIHGRQAYRRLVEVLWHAGVLSDVEYAVFESILYENLQLIREIQARSK